MWLWNLLELIQLVKDRTTLWRQAVWPHSCTFNLFSLSPSDIVIWIIKGCNQKEHVLTLGQMGKEELDKGLYKRGWLDSEGCAASGQAKTWERRMPGMGAMQERMRKEVLKEVPLFHLLVFSSPLQCHWARTIQVFNIQHRSSTHLHSQVIVSSRYKLNFKS